ncbi:hypothetical protein TSH100_08180 [Azospirillum sp. TSH100]|uniref:hypothetical protein n=1 Tax=Azospirillum sp. TSH100 TaxID=652764 RepID=UPI000D61B419|nr:hypothetical protein [Azospirillum sp. TSH100]PWC88063.1 hypothetical protein TSH100_08180 [Azospirillum sp. TSH100]QCG92201.1 hypothetical protein E6C72_30915 [Azospirillum sp. TSH100]
MSEIAIHQLPAASSLSGDEILPIDDGTATLRTTVAAIRQGLSPTGHGHIMGDVAGLQTALNAKAPLAGPAFTGAVTVSAGNAATPALSPAGDPDTGLFFPAADTVAFTAGGVERLSIPNNGYIGLVPADQRVRIVASSSPNLDMENQTGADNEKLWRLNVSGGQFSIQTVTDSYSAAATALQVVRSGLSVTMITVGGGIGNESLRVAAVSGATRCITVTGSGGGDPTVGTSAGRLAFGAIPVLPSYTVATLPTAAARGLIYVSDGAGGKKLAVSDGANWRWPDGAIVS